MWELSRQPTEEFDVTILQTQRAATTETDQRMAILNSFLTMPHRQLALAQPIHQTLSEQDPLFYRQLAAWYAIKGEIRDHKEAFIINLLLSTFPGSRDVGLAMLRELPPYQVVRVVDFIAGAVTVIKTYNQEEVKAYKAAVAVARKAIKPSKELSKEQLTELRKAASKTVPVPVAKVTKERVGLFRNIPNSTVTEITRYLREREADPTWFDAGILSARKHMRRLYQLHIKPSDRARQILFENVMPEGSRLAALRAVAKATNPVDQARAIIEHRIPYRVAISFINEMSPTVILALVEVMTPQEIMSNLSSLKSRGAFDNPDIKSRIDAKLVAAKSNKRVAALKGGEAIKVADLDDDTKAAVMAVQDAQIKRKGRITHRLGLLIDKSRSMSTSIEVGKKIGAMVSSASSGELYTYAFDNMTYEIKPAGTTLDDWEKAFLGVKPGGNTSCGVAIDGMRRKQIKVDQFIMVTDGGDNSRPSFSEAYHKYCQELGITPSVVVVKIHGDHDAMTPAAKAAGIEFDTWDFKGDYFSLPGLIPILCKTDKLDLLMEVMSTPLPVRKLS